MNFLRLHLPSAVKRLSVQRIQGFALIYFAYSFRFISPLVLYPVLSRRLGIDGFSIYITAYAVALIVSIIVEYGFNLTGTRDIAAAQGAAERAKLVKNIYLAKSLLLLPAALVGVSMCLISPIISSSKTTIFAAIIIGISLGMSPFWYFQGAQRIYSAVGFELVGQMAALIGIIMLVSGPADYNVALLLQASGAVLASSFGALVVIMSYRTHGANFSIAASFRILREGVPIFLSRSSVMILGASGVFILGLTSTPSHAAWYGAAERIIAPAAALIRPMSAILLPKLAIIAKADALRAARITAYICGIITALYGSLAMIVAVGAEKIFNFAFGSEFAGGASVLSWLALLMPISALNVIIINQLMVAMRLDTQIAKIVLSGSFLSLSFGVVLSIIYGAHGMAAARVFAEMVMLFVAAAYVSKKAGLLHS